MKAVKGAVDRVATKLLKQHYFVDTDGMLYTPSGRAAYRIVRLGRRDYPSAIIAAAMQRQLRSRA